MASSTFSAEDGTPDGGLRSRLPSWEPSPLAYESTRQRFQRPTRLSCCSGTRTVNRSRRRRLLASSRGRYPINIRPAGTYLPTSRSDSRTSQFLRPVSTASRFLSTGSTRGVFGLGLCRACRQRLNRPQLRHRPARPRCERSRACCDLDWADPRSGQHCAGRRLDSVHLGREQTRGSPERPDH